MRILGVNVGQVTAVIPEGNSVRVEMEYDAEYKVPADAKAVDRHPDAGRRPVRPAHARRTTRAPVMADGADIALPDTGVPVELDRIYAQPARPDRGARAQRRQQGRHPRPRCSRPARKALEGNGELGNEMLRNLSEAAETFGDGSGDLFDDRQRAGRVHRALADERPGWSGRSWGTSPRVSPRWPTSATSSSGAGPVAGAVGTVETFVADNREALVTDVEKLTRV